MFVIGALSNGLFGTVAGATLLLDEMRSRSRINYFLPAVRVSFEMKSMLFVQALTGASRALGLVAVVHHLAWALPPVTHQLKHHVIRHSADHHKIIKYELFEYFLSHNHLGW